MKATKASALPSSLPRVQRVAFRYFEGRRPNPKQWEAHLAAKALAGTGKIGFVGIAGASGSGKSVWLIEETLYWLLSRPGLHALLSRWTDDATERIIQPLFYDIVRTYYPPEILGRWHSDERYQEFINGSRLYIHGLKSSDENNRYTKFDGYSLGLYAVSQAEEIPADIWDRLRTRLRQPGDYPRLGLFELNPTTKDHHLYAEFVERADAAHVMVHASMYDNAANLPPGYIEAAERDYPPGHPLRRRLIEGGWGLAARGDPVIGMGLFNPDLHVREVAFDAELPLILSYDPGFQHPALVWVQMTPDGQLRVLDCLLGTDVYADEFFAQAFQRQREVLGEPREVWACADRAAEQRHGSSTRTEWDIFREHLRPWGVTPLTGIVASKQYLIQRLAARFTRLVRGQPAIVFHPRCEYLIDAVAGGWVWKPETEARPAPRAPQENYYSHGMDALLYVEMHFGPSVRKPRLARGEEETAPRRVRRWYA